jgi:hypothetical protein
MKPTKRLGKPENLAPGDDLSSGPGRRLHHGSEFAVDGGLTAA